MKEIKVKVVEFGDRPHYQMQFVDPITGRKKTKSTGIERTGLKRDRVEAERVAAKWEAELREGRYCEPSRISWAVFRERYENEVLSGLATGTLKRTDTVFDLVERRLNPQRVKDVTAERLSWLVSELRKPFMDGDGEKPGLAETSIKSYMAHLKAALRWAERVEIIVKAPKFPKLQRAHVGDAAKGRAISVEEFDRMIAAVPKIVDEAKVQEWQRYLRGLWLSGFRIGESLALSWDDGAGIAVDLTGRNPVVHIKAASQKSHRTETVPLAPEFGQLLAAVPNEQRTGFVFHPENDLGGRASRLIAIRTVSAIGREAGVQVWTHPKTGATKTATAHDLRRSFGTRWASRVMPAVLQQMMRHASIQTTMTFYVTRNAEAAGDVIREAFEKSTLGNISGNSPSAEQEKSTHD